MKNRRYHIVIASVVFAVLTWVSINLRDEYTIVKLIPVVIENLREEKALKHPVPKNLAVRFRGSGWSLAALYLTSDVKYFIDASSLGPDDIVVTSRDILEHMKLPGALDFIDVKPDSLVLALDDYREVRVPVFPHIMLNFREGYGQVGEMKVTPESVIVGGAQAIVAPIVGWPTIYKRFDNVRTPVDMDVALEEPNTYSVDVLRTSVHVQVNVQSIAEKTFSDIPVTATGVPPNQEIVFIPPKMEVIVRGGIEELSKLSPSDFRAQASYEAVVSDSSESIAPTLIAPAEVKVVSRKPERFRFIIRTKL